VRKKSLKFKHMSKNTIKLVFTLLGNQNLLRYIHYLGDYNPLDGNLPNASPGEVKVNNFILTTFNEKILEETKISIFLNPHRINFNRSATAKLVFELVIVVPYKYWIIKDIGELRACSIAYEIAQTIDQQNIVGIGDVFIIDGETFKLNDTFSGLAMYIETISPTIKV